MINLSNRYKNSRYYVWALNWLTCPVFVYDTRYLVILFLLTGCSPRLLCEFLFIAFPLFVKEEFIAVPVDTGIFG